MVKVIRISEQVVVNWKFLIFANELFYLSRYSGKNRNGALPAELKALTCQLMLIINLKTNNLMLWLMRECTYLFFIHMQEISMKSPTSPSRLDWVSYSVSFHQYNNSNKTFMHFNKLSTYFTRTTRKWIAEIFKIRRFSKYLWIFLFSHKLFDTIKENSDLDSSFNKSKIEWESLMGIIKF